MSAEASGFGSGTAPSRRGFEGRVRWLAAALLVIGPLLQVVEFALENPPDDNSLRVSNWVANMPRTEVSMAAGLLAVPFLIGAFGLAASGNRAAALSVLESNNVGLGGIVLLVMFLGGAALGTVTLAVAVWRSPLVPRVVTVFLLAFAVLDFIAGQGIVSHVVNLIGFAIAAAAVLTAYSREPKTTSWRSRLAW
jgi:hypothetical protein